MDPLTSPSSVSLLRSKRYAFYWVASLLSNIGTWMQQVAQPWIILSMSHSPFLVGLDSFALNAPGWLFTLWGGILADRLDRKKVILVFQTIQFVSVAALLALLITGRLQVWMIIAISFVVGTTDSLSMPSFQSIIPSLVEHEDIPRAVALNSTQFNLSRMLGPAIAGLLMARLGAVACFGSNVLSYIPFFISLFWIYPKVGARIKKTPDFAPPSTTTYSFKKLLQNREITIPLLTVFVTSIFCAPLMTFCPVLIKDVFRAEVSDFGGALAAFGFGGLIGAVLSVLPFPLRVSRLKVATLSAIVLGLLVAAIAANRSLVLLFVLMVMAGCALTISNIFASSYLQENADNRSRGKIVSLYQLAIHGGISAGSLLTGFTSAQWGISVALSVSAGIAVVLQLWILRLPRHGAPVG